MKMRKGFTLVELLIVIVIIGVLASAMLLSSGSATDSAVASKIVSNLRTMKAAVVMYRGDNNGVAPTTDADVAQYLGGSTTLSTGYLYDWTNQLAKYDDSKHKDKKDKVLESQKVRDKLAEIATKEKNLYKADGKTLYTNTDKIITMKL